WRWVGCAKQERAPFGILMCLIPWAIGHGCVSRGWGKRRKRGGVAAVGTICATVASGLCLGSPTKPLVGFALISGNTGRDFSRGKPHYLTRALVLAGNWGIEDIPSTTQ